MLILRQSRDGLLDGIEQPPQPIGFLLQQLLVIMQSLHLIEPGFVEDGLNVRQRKIEFAEEQDLLQPQQIGLTVQAIARRGSGRRFQQPDVVVVVQRPDADPGQSGQLLHGVGVAFAHDAQYKL